MDRRIPLENCSIGLVGTTCCPTVLTDGGGTRRHVSPGWRPEPGAWTDWARYGPRGNRYNPHASPPRSEPEIAWTYEYDGNLSSRSFAVADGTGFGVFDSELYALDTTDGEILWREPTSRGGTVFYVDGRLYHGTSGGVEALTLAGDVDWRLDEKTANVAGETDGYVYTTTPERRIS